MEESKKRPKLPVKQIWILGENRFGEHVVFANTGNVQRYVVLESQVSHVAYY